MSSSSPGAATSSPTSWRTASRRCTSSTAPESRGPAPPAPHVGRVTDYAEGFDRYVAHLIGVLPNRLDGLKVVLDEAHGAAARVSPEAFARAGAEVVTIGAEPDGLNINDGCGSTHLALLRAAVVEYGAHLGIAHDGDADRCLAVDAAGEEVDGDQILAVLALAMREAGQLRGDTVVGTVMSNLGFKIAMEREGIRLVQTAVGDRYVLESMKAEGYALGGEQSGHVIVLDHATTGDGTLTGLMLAARVAATGRSLAELAGVMERLPQVLVNVPDVDKSRVHTSQEVSAAVTQAEHELGATGRVLLRPSGTEPLVRVMVEAADIEQARAVAGRPGGRREVGAGLTAGEVWAPARTPTPQRVGAVGFVWARWWARWWRRVVRHSAFWASSVSVPAATIPPRFASSCCTDPVIWP